MSIKEKGWDSITIKKWYDIEKTLEQHEHPIAKRVAKFAVAMNMDFKELYAMPKVEADKLMKPYLFLDTQIPKTKVSSWGGYKLTYDISELNAGQLIDIDTMSKDGDRDMEDFIAVLASKEGMSLKDRTDDIFNRMPITIAMGVYAFFLHRTTLFARLFPKYIHLQLWKMKWNLKLRGTLLRIRSRLTFNGLFGSSKS